MNTEALKVLHHFGGTSAVAKLIDAPTSTVHSWRTIGIPSSRLAHLRLVGKEIGKLLPEDLSSLPMPSVDDAGSQVAA
jgi:hypothetical protein